MGRLIRQFREARPQTKFFVLTVAIYLIALLWTTAQAYLRLEYNRSGVFEPLFVEPQPPPRQKAPPS